MEPAAPKSGVHRVVKCIFHIDPAAHCPIISGALHRENRLASVGIVKLPKEVLADVVEQFEFAGRLQFVHKLHNLLQLVVLYLNDLIIVVLSVRLVETSLCQIRLRCPLVDASWFWLRWRQVIGRELEVRRNLIPKLLARKFAIGNVFQCFLLIRLDVWYMLKHDFKHEVKVPADESGFCYPARLHRELLLGDLTVLLYCKVRS